MDKIIAFFEKIPLGYRIFTIFLCALVSPWIFTRPWSDDFYFDETGQIGDTIGGLTAPVIGLLNAWLLYITLKRQNDQSKLQVEHFNEQRRYDDYDRRVDTIIKIIDSMRLTVGSKMFPSDDKIIYVGPEAVIAMSSLFNIPFDQDIYDYDIKGLEMTLNLWRATEINLQVHFILYQNEISNRSSDEKEFIEKTLSGVTSVITEMYDSVNKFSEEYPDHPSKKVLYIDKFLELKKNYEIGSKPKIQ